MSEIDHVGLWNRCLEIIRDNVPEQTYKTWFLPIIPLKYEDKTLVVQVPSQFFYEFLEDKFVDLLRKTLYKVIGEGTKLMYNVMVDKSSRKTVDLESTQRTIIPQKQVMDKRIPQIPVPELITDKKLLLIDDSIVRGTQLRETVDFLYKSGAKEVHMRSACPPIMYSCLTRTLIQNTTLKPSSKVTATSCRAALQKLSLSIRLKQSSIRCSYTEHQV